MGGAGITVGVDVGTSSCKAVLLDRDGAVTHVAHASYPTRHRVDGEATQDPHHWLRAVRETLRSCAAALDGAELHGIGITAPAHVGVLTDAAGEPLARSLLAFDGRPAAIAAALRDRYGDPLFESTFVHLSAGWTLPQIHWLREREPAIWPRIRWLLTQKDWIRYRMTGQVLMDASDAAGTAMVDQRDRTWLEPVCRDVGLAPDQLPPIVASTASGGGLSPAWARATGLRAGTPVVVGATDTAAELVSVGAFSGGEGLVKIASTGTVVGVSRDPVLDRRLLTYPHVVPGTWYTLAATNAASTAYDWLRRTVAVRPSATGELPYAEMDRRAARVRPGAEGLLFLPFLAGERSPWWDADLRAAFLGISSAHTFGHLCRAVLEGVAMSLRSCWEAVAEAGLRIDRPVLGGGGVASASWRSILVAVLGTVARLVEPYGPAVGAAILAGAIDCTSASDIRARVATPRTSLVRPRADWSRTYDDLYDVYVLATARTADVSHRLAATSLDGRVTRRGM